MPSGFVMGSAFAGHKLIRSREPIGGWIRQPPITEEGQPPAGTDNPNADGVHGP